MARFLLIHGASHGAWCWDRLAPCLQKQGHEVKAIDLPSHGDDPTPTGDVTMNDYVTAALDAMAPETILVGHSLGGLTITLAAAKAPEKTRALVYLCALVPQQGKAFADFRNDAISPAVSETQTVDRAAGATHVIPDKAADVFYFDCSEEDRAFALARLSPQPIAPLIEPLEFDVPNCPRHYIRCQTDRVVMPAYQQAVSENWPHVHTMQTGHSPFFSDPTGLAAILHRIAQA